MPKTRFSLSKKPQGKFRHPEGLNRGGDCGYSASSYGGTGGEKGQSKKRRTFRPIKRPGCARKYYAPT